MIASSHPTTRVPQRAFAGRRRAMIGRIDDRLTRRVIVELIQLVQVGAARIASKSGRGRRLMVHMRRVGEINEQQRKRAEFEFEHVFGRWRHLSLLLLLRR